MVSCFTVVQTAASIKQRYNIKKTFCVLEHVEYMKFMSPFFVVVVFARASSVKNTVVLFYDNNESNW